MSQKDAGKDKTKQKGTKQDRPKSGAQKPAAPRQPTKPAPRKNPGHTDHSTSHD